MGLFKDMLQGNESIFKNEMALDYEFLPKLLPYRENEQKYLATCIAPLLQQRNGRNLLVHGAPGIGKTAAIKHVFRDLEEETEDVIPIYINCWQKNTTYKVILEICQSLGYPLTHNKRTDELFQIIKKLLAKKGAVFAFDEIDKLEDYDFLYGLLEELYKKSIILITNYEEWLEELDERIKSRLLPEKIEFKKYNLKEMEGILQERIGYAFVENVWEKEAIKEIAKKAYELGDVRTGLYLLRQAGLIAEAKSSKTIKKEFVKEAINKLADFSSKNKNDLEDETKKILEIIKKNSGKKIGELFEIYKEETGNAVYKTFQRKIRKLSDNRFITTEKIKGGTTGTTTIVHAETTKKLGEFEGFKRGDEV